MILVISLFATSNFATRRGNIQKRQKELEAKFQRIANLSGHQVNNVFTTSLFIEVEKLKRTKVQHQRNLKGKIGQYSLCQEKLSLVSHTCFFYFLSFFIFFFFEKIPLHVALSSCNSYPSLHRHSNDPGEFSQIWPHPPFADPHSFMSYLRENKKIRKLEKIEILEKIREKYSKSFFRNTD